MAQHVRPEGSPEPSPNRDPVSDRIVWLLDTKFTGNRSELGRAIGLSPSAISRVVAGQKPPGRRMVTAIVEKLGVDADWLLRGVGAPFRVVAGAEHPTVMMPLRSRLLVEPPPGDQGEGAGGMTAVPALRPRTQYLYRLGPHEPVLAARGRGFILGDLLLMETDPARFPPPEWLWETICVVKDKPGAKPAARLAAVSHYEATDDDGPAHLKADLFVAEADESQQIEEFILRRYPDGTLKALQRRARLVKTGRRDRVVEVPGYNNATVARNQPRRIDYSDIVAAWTGALFRYPLYIPG